MQTKDHLALGHFLLNLSDRDGLNKHRRAFLLGCVEPDFNMASYARGLSSHRKFRGHNTNNSFSYVVKCLTGFQRNGVNSAWDYFKLGTMLHYVADAFTWPHNAFWDKNLLEHAAYEAELHKMFSPKLAVSGIGTARRLPLSLLDFFSGSHAAYHAAPRGIETDCRYILGVCETMLLGSLRYAAPSLREKYYLKEVQSYEGAYNHGLV